MNRTAVQLLAAGALALAAFAAGRITAPPATPAPPPPALPATPAPPATGNPLASAPAAVLHNLCYGARYADRSACLGYAAGAYIDGRGAWHCGPAELDAGLLLAALAADPPTAGESARDWMRRVHAAAWPCEGAAPGGWRAAPTGPGF